MKNENKNNTKANAKATEVKVNKTVIATVEHHDISKPITAEKPIAQIVPEAPKAETAKTAEPKEPAKPAETKTEYKPAKRESASSRFMKLFQLAVDNGKITKEIENKLTDKEYSKEQFKLSYPLLLKIVEGKDLREQRKINNYYRYQSKTVKINGHEYLVCNNIYDKNVDAMKTWIQQF